MTDLVAELDRDLPGAVQESDGVACLLPRNASEIGTALRLARSHGGRLRAPGAPAREDDVVLDLRRLGSVVAHDDTSLISHVQAGVRLAALEEDLRRRGLTLGMEGPPGEDDVGTWLAGGAPGCRSKDDDPVDQVVAGIELVLPNGEALALRPAPRRAVGPDLVSTLVGARGRLGVITAAHLIVRRAGDVERVAYRFADRARAETALAWIRGHGARPSHSRIVEHDGHAVITLGIAGPRPLRAVRLALVARIAEEHGGAEVDEALEEPPPLQPVEPSPIVEELAMTLDPAGVLG